MASKGQKFNKYSKEFICKIMEEVRTGKSSLQLAKKYNIPAKTIRTWKRKRIIHPELYLNQGQKKESQKEKI